jgi:serine protease Do
MKRIALRPLRGVLPLLISAFACVPDGPPAAVASTTLMSWEPAAAPQQVDPSLAAALSATFRGAAQRALPAVVYVAVEREDPPRLPELRVPEDFWWFFEPEEPLELPPQVLTGTGFIYDGSGLVLTSGHVVEGASTVRVTLRDGRELDADVKGVDPTTDVAVIALRGQPGSFETIELGSSDALQVGDWVLALGNPLGLDFTVTAGIVSAKGRQLTGGDGTQLEAFIQTDAAINPGNSGGPLIDLSGRAVGINAAIYGGERYVGYGFAVPIDLARRVASDLIEFGRVRRPRLGIRVSDVTAVDAEAYGLERISGAEVNTVESGSPGARAGLRPGDVIVQIDDDPVPDATALTTRLAQMRPGDTVRLTVFRTARRLDLVATLGEFETAEEEAVAPAQPQKTSAEQILGFRVEPFTPQLARRFELPEMEVGAVIITEVETYSAAARAGVRVGQRLVLLEGETVRRVEDVERIAARLAGGEAVSLRVLDPEVGETVINFRASR